MMDLTLNLLTLEWKDQEIIGDGIKVCIAKELLICGLEEINIMKAFMET